MSELVSRVHKLSDKISELEENVLDEKRKYADEVDHSDQLAHLLTLLHNGKNCVAFCSFCDIIRTHEMRRSVEDSVTSASRTVSEQTVDDL
jgi:hypothetical protein